MANQAYITLMGRSGWAVLNSFYASIIETEYRPDQVHLIYESEYANDIDPVMRGLEIIQSSYITPNVKALEVPNWDAHATGHAIRELVQDLQKEKSEK